MSNNSTQESGSNPSEELAIIRLVFQIAIAVLGVIGNVVVVVKIIWGRNTFSVMTPYILSLAFADLGILLINYPLAILKIHFPGEFFLGEVVCLYITPFAETFFGACIWSIVAIAAERYMQVAWQITVPHLRKRQSKRIVCILVFIWLVSFLVAGLPPYFHYTYHSVTRECYPEYTVKKFRVVTIVNAIFLFFLPLCTISLSYQRTSKLVGQRAFRLQDQTPNSSAEASREKIKKNTDAILIQTRKTKRLLIPLVILFAVTMLPYHSFTLLLAYADTSKIPLDFLYNYMTVVTVFVAINSAADPFVYCIINDEFRREIKTALSRCFQCRLGTWRRRVRSASANLQIANGSAGITNKPFVQAHETYL
ncbi:galanin receptor type 2-like [Acropora millepora]|uniref:galanin receptor type 2-like n=1 Tax=Acropora millepora TaxID=45264 RepID=UPI001CF2528B|nr:galanin receptor type 2-like [Acropora millepora]